MITQHFCYTCLPGLNKWSTGVLRESNIPGKLQCYNCGTRYLEKEKGGIKVLDKEPLEYIKSITKRLENYKKNEYKALAPIIVPIIWTLYQKSHKRLQDSYNIQYISCNSGFLINFGLHSLCTLYQANPSTHNPLDTYNVIKQHLQSNSKKVQLMGIFVDVFEEELLNGINDSDVVVFCIKDNRKEERKQLSNPIVYSIV